VLQVTTERWAGARAGAGPIVVAGAGLVLREWSESDLGAMTDLFDEPEIDRWTPLESPFDRDAARRYLTRADLRRSEGSALQLAVTQDGAAPLGEVLLFDQGGDLAELGYGIGRAYRGRGLAARAIRVLIAEAVLGWGYRRFRLRIEPENAASVRVALDCGFARSGEQPAEMESKGRRIRIAVWELSVEPGRAGGEPPGHSG
jgi:RimJ/RimL family protein N-acetyltransferase